MKIVIQNIRLMIVMVLVMAVARQATAAGLSPKAYQVTVSPTTGSGTVGVNSAVTSTVTISEGSTVATTGVNLSASVSPSGQGVNAILTSTGPFTGSTATTTLTVTNVSATAQTYTVTVNSTPASTGTNNMLGASNFTYTVTAPAVGTINWTAGSGTDTNWTDGNNWSSSSPPVAGNDVKFFNAGATNAAGTVNNVVNSSYIINSLAYGETNGFHTTLIASGNALTLSNSITDNILYVGTGSDDGALQNTNINTIEGNGGKLVIVGTNDDVVVSQNTAATGNSTVTLNLSGLGNLSANVAGLYVGQDAVVGIKGASGILYLAETNTITMTPGTTAPQIDVGDNTLSQGTSGTNSFLYLGQTNTFFVDSITVGRGKCVTNSPSSMLFQNGLSSPTAYFYGTNGTTGRVSTWNIADGSTAKGTAVATNDFNLGTVNAMVGTMNVGIGSSATGGGTPSTGNLIFSAGTVNVNTLNVGISIGPTGGEQGAGIVTANGGSLIVNTILILASNITSSGTLNISSATVTANNGIVSGGGAATINLTSSTLNVTNSTATIGTSANAIGALDMTNSTLYVAAQNSTVAATVTNLSASGANTISISTIPIIIGAYPVQYTIIKYASSGGGLGTFASGTLPGTYKGYISNNVGNSSIDLVVTNGVAPVPVLTWDGVANGNWDTSTANWTPHGGASPSSPVSGPDTSYSQGSYVTFNDTLTGTNSVSLVGTLTPLSLAINDSASNYIFAGSGQISGSISLVKSGTATLTLAESGGDNFSGGITVNSGTVVIDNNSSSVSGGTTISGGTVQLGNNDGNGVLPAGNVIDGGALVFNQAANFTVTNIISGAGTITQSDTNIVTLNASNLSYSGAIIVAQGTLQPGLTNSFGSASSLTVTNGGTLDVNGQALFGGGSVPPVTVSGAGVNGAGAIINSGSSQSKVLHVVTMAANTTLGGTGDWDIRNSSGANANPDAQLNGAFNLTKTGTNDVTLTSVTVDPNLANINVQSGTLTVASLTTSLGNPANSLTVYSNATLVLSKLTNDLMKPLVFSNGASLQSSGTNLVGGVITLAGAGTVTVSVGSSAQLTLSNVVNGSAGFSKNGTNTLFLGATDTYSGKTLIGSGVVALNGTGSICNSTNINISAGSTFDVSGVASPYNFSTTNTLTATGTGTAINNTAATINGASGGTVNLGSQPITLTYDRAHPSLYISQGMLSLNGNAFTVNTTNNSPLAIGTYTIVQQASGNITSNGTFTVSGSALGGGNGGYISVVGGNVNLVVYQPMAAPMTVYRTAGLNLLVALSEMATNWSDAGGSSVKLTGVNLLTTNGQTLFLLNVVTNSGAFAINSTSFVGYTNGPNVADQFSYSIADSNGATNIGLVNIVILPAVSGQATGIVSPIGGAATVSFAGIPGDSYTVQRSTNLSIGSGWVTIWTTNAPAGGLFNYTDSFGDLGGVPASAYYRLSW